MFEGIVGLALITTVAVFVAVFILEVMHIPVMSDQEWDIEQCKRQLPHTCRINGPCNGWPNDSDASVAGTGDPK